MLLPLWGRSLTGGVAENGIGGLRRAFTPAFRAGSLYPLIPLARGCRRCLRGEFWFRRRDAAPAMGSLAYGRGCGEWHRGATACFHSGISGWFSLSLNPFGAWVPKKPAWRNLVSAARCCAREGLARSRERLRCMAYGGYGVLSLRHFALVLFIP